MSAETEPQPPVVDKGFVDKIAQSLHSRCDQAKYPNEHRNGRDYVKEWNGIWEEGNAQIGFNDKSIEPRGLLALLGIRQPSRHILVVKKILPREGFGFASVALSLKCSGDRTYLQANYYGEWVTLEEPVRVNHPDDITLLERIATDPFGNRVFDQDEL